MSGNPQRSALLVLMLGAAVIGIGPILVRLTHTGPSAAAFWRLGLALPVLVVLAVTRRKPAGEAPPPMPVLGLAGLMFGADLICWHYSIHYTSVANATVLSNLTPILVTVAVWLLFRERPRAMFLMGLTLAIGGAVLMAVARPAGVHPPSSPHLGDALAAFTASLYGVYFLAVREARKTQTATTVMLWSTVIALPLTFAAAVALKEPIMPTLAVGWLACAGLGAMHLAGQGAIAWSLGRLPTALAAVVVLVQPVVAAALGWLAFGERISVLQAVGGILALAGVVVAQRSARAAYAEPEAAQAALTP